MTAPKLGSPLSPQEQVALLGISFGLTNTQIGRLLNVHEESVKRYASHAYRKLGAKDRAHAMRLAFEHGILTVGQANPLRPRDAR